MLHGSVSGGDEEQVTRWIEAVSGETKSGDFHAWLKDGRVLCRAANKIQEGAVAKVNPAGMPFREMENVTAFLRACKGWGVLEKDTFSTVDLYEGRNLKAVQSCIIALDGTLRATGRFSAAPQIGVARNSCISDVARASVAATQDIGFRRDISDEIRRHGTR